MAAQGLALQVGVAPACQALGCVTSHVLPSSEVDSRAPAAPSNARPGAVRIGA